MTRGNVLPKENDNARKFKEKHGVDTQDLRNLLARCHSVVDEVAPRFPLDEAPQVPHKCW